MPQKPCTLHMQGTSYETGINHDIFRAVKESFGKYTKYEIKGAKS